MAEVRRPQREDTPLRASVPLGRWAGVPVGAHWSVLVAVAMFATLLASAVLPEAAPHQSQGGYWIAGCITSVVFLVTLLAHELAHAVAARHYGMVVKRITLWMLGGFTELDGEPPSARADAIIAGSGPATSVVIGLATGAVAFWLDSASLPVVALAWLAGVNLLLGVFNLMPGAPLDGGRLLRAFMWWRTGDRRRAVETATRAGRALGMGMMMLGLIEVLMGYYAGLWLALVGWFIMTSAVGERMAESAHGLTGLHVRDVMAASPTVTPQWWTVAEFLDRLDAVYARQPLFPLIDFEGHVVGVVTARDLDRVTTQQRATVRMRDVPRPARMLLARPDAALADLAAALPTHGGCAVVVDDQNRPLGLVTAEDVARAARLAELGWRPPPVAHGPANPLVK